MEIGGAFSHSHQTAAYPIQNQINPVYYPIPCLEIRFNIIPDQSLGLPGGLLPAGFPTKTLYAPILFPIRAISPFHLILLDLVLSPLLPCYLVTLRPKYLPLYPILEYPQPMFHPQCETPNFTTAQNNRQNYSSVYFKVYILG